MPTAAGSYERIYAVVSRIPRGRVATCGQVAQLAGFGGQARLVGYALSALDDRSRIPWHRVVNASGQISARRDGSPAGILQRFRLEREDVRFNAQSCIRLDLFRWCPRGRRAAVIRKGVTDRRTSLTPGNARRSPAGLGGLRKVSQMRSKTAERKEP